MCFTKMKRIALSPVIYRSLLLSFKGGLSIPRIQRNHSVLYQDFMQIQGDTDFQLLPCSQMTNLKPKQTATNLLPYRLPENTNAYQFMQVGNRSVHQPTSPSVSILEIHPDIIQGTLLFLFSIHKETGITIRKRGLPC